MSELIDNYAERLKSLLLHQFRDKPNVLGFVDGFAISAQDTEDEIHRFFNELSLNEAIDAQLDGIGEILGEARESRPDSEYRASLSVRITINISRGEPETLISVLSAITESTFVLLTEVYPARIEMFFNGVVIPDNLIANMNQVKSAGVELVLISNPTGTPFVFTGDTSGEGFNEFGLDIGGSLTEVYS